MLCHLLALVLLCSLTSAATPPLNVGPIHSGKLSVAQVLEVVYCVYSVDPDLAEFDVDRVLVPGHKLTADLIQRTLRYPTPDTLPKKIFSDFAVNVASLLFDKGHLTRMDYWALLSAIRAIGVKPQDLLSIMDCNGNEPKLPQLKPLGLCKQVGGAWRVRDGVVAELATFAGSLRSLHSTYMDENTGAFEAYYGALEAAHPFTKLSTKYRPWFRTAWRVVAMALVAILGVVVFIVVMVFWIRKILRAKLRKPSPSGVVPQPVVPPTYTSSTSGGLDIPARHEKETA